MTSIPHHKIAEVISAAWIVHDSGYRQEFVDKFVSLVSVSMPSGFSFIPGNRKIRTLLRMPRGNPVPVKRLRECVEAWIDLGRGNDELYRRTDRE